MTKVNTNKVNEAFDKLFFIILLGFIYRGSLFSIFLTLIYHKVLINNKTEQNTEQDKQTKIMSLGKLPTIGF